MYGCILLWVPLPPSAVIVCKWLPAEPVVKVCVCAEAVLVLRSAGEDEYEPLEVLHLNWLS